MQNKRIQFGTLLYIFNKTHEIIEFPPPQKSSYFPHELKEEEIYKYNIETHENMRLVVGFPTGASFLVEIIYFSGNMIIVLVKRRKAGEVLGE